MRFSILGPLEVHDGDRPLALEGRRQRALLALLLLNANEVVSSDRLIEEIWGEERVDAGGKSLQVAVSRLRRTLEPDRTAGATGGLLVTRPPGYELRLDRGQLDLHRFEDGLATGRAALAAGDPERAADELRAALALWRGPALADLSYEPFAQAELRRLEELRTVALEERVATDLELGRDADLVAELPELVGRYPLRERLREHLMLALYRAGRQADALAAYQDARRTLVDELGIEPGLRLRELHERILQQDPELERRAAAPAAGRLDPAAAAPADDRRDDVFVGRERELATLTGALEDALAGGGRLALVAGEPGIGKSRLTEELARHARARGARVLVGRCWEAGGAPAYWPWVQSLRAYARETEPEAMRAQLGEGAADVAQILPELRQLFPSLPEPVAPESEGARFRLFEAASSFMLAAARERPLVLVLDDLHAADEPSLLLLRFVARELPGGRLLVVGAYRDVDPALRDPLTAALAELVREPQTTQIGLRGLGEPDVADYIQLATGTEPAPRQVQAIHAGTEGNPLFVTEVVHLLDAEGAVGEAGVQTPIPPGVRAAIGQRVARLSERCRQLLLPASVMGREFDLDALVEMSDHSRNDVLDALDEAMAERLVTAAPGSPGRLRFGHALIRDTLYDDLATARRMQLHQRAAEAIESAHSGDLEPHFAELAYHYSAAVPLGVADRAVEYARRAGDGAAAQLAYEEAARLYELGLSLVGEAVARGELLLALGRVRARAGAVPDSKRVFREAAELAERNDQPEQLARAALGYGIAGAGIIWDVSRDDEYVLPLLERALVALGDEAGPLRVRVLSRLAGGPLRDARYPAERRHALSTEALAIARKLDDPATLAYALEGYILAHHSPDHTPRQLELATELVEVATRAGEKERLLNGHDERFDTLFELGDVDGARAELEIMVPLAAELRQPITDWLVSTEEAMLALFEGRLEEAEAQIEESYEVGKDGLGWNADVVRGLQLYGLRWMQGRLAEVEELVRRSVEEHPTYRIWRCVHAHLQASLGHVDAARDAFDALAADGFEALPFDEEWLVSMCLLAQTAGALGDGAGAEGVYRRLEPYADRIAVSYPEITTGAVARDLGVAAATMERWDDAARHFEAALECNERNGGGPWLAHTRRDYARMLLARDGLGDAERGRALLSDAVAAYRELGMEADAAATEPLGR